MKEKSNNSFNQCSLAAWPLPCRHMQVCELKLHGKYSTTFVTSSLGYFTEAFPFLRAVIDA